MRPPLGDPAQAQLADEAIFSEHIGPRSDGPTHRASRSSSQKHLLLQGAQVGELMAINFSFNKRFEGAKYRPDANWVYVLEMRDPNQEDDNLTQLDQRTAWLYEATRKASPTNPRACQTS